MTSSPIVEAAPAKLNLFLRVTGKRADGYHLLDSLVVFTETGDRITAQHADTLSLSVTGPYAHALQGEGDNLVLRAARALQAASGEARGAALTLDKHLPVASGIGGGSSDAAATLRALNRLWGLGLPRERLAEIGLSLGADIAVCAVAEARRMQGIGDILLPVGPVAAVDLLLVNPNVALPTGPVFKTRTGTFSPPFGPLPALDSPEALAEVIKAAGNDLTAPAQHLCPAVAEVISTLSALPQVLCGAMSGSGATCFALFPDAPATARAAELLRSTHPDWWITPTRLAQPA